MAVRSLILFLLTISLSINGIRSAHVDEALSLIQQDLAKATDTLNHAAELFRQASDRGQSERYGTCMEELRAATSRNLPSAAAAVKSATYETAVKELKAAAQNAYNCEQQFAAPLASPLAHETNAIKALAAKAIAAIQRPTLRRR